MHLRPEHRNRAIIAALAVITFTAWRVYRVVDARPVAETFTSVKLDKKLALSIVPSEECITGEIDVLLSDLPFTPLIATLEPIVVTDTSFPRIAKSLDREGLKRRLNLTFDVPSRRSVVNLGVFICSDKAGTKRCADKAVHSYDEYLASGTGRKSKVDKAVDHIYFFQYLVATQTSLQFISGAETLKQAKVAVDAALIRVPASTPKQTQMVRKTILKFLGKIGSMPITTASSDEGASLDVNMTKFNADTCAVSTKQVKKTRMRFVPAGGGGPAKPRRSVGH